MRRHQLMTNYLVQARNIQLYLWLTVTLRLLSAENWGHLPPGWPGHVTTDGQWPAWHMGRDGSQAIGHHITRHVSAPTSAIITPYITTTTYLAKKYQNLWQNWYIVIITSVLSFSTIGVNYCEAKRILCEFVTEIRHTVIVTKSVISHGSVIRGTMPRHNITLCLWQCDPI